MTFENTASEKRLASRISVTLPVKIASPEEGSATGEIVNLSPFGFLCLMKKPLLPETPVRLTLLMPPVNPQEAKQSQSMKSVGVVVREDIQSASDEGLRHTVAVRFTEMEEADRSRLNAYLERSLNPGPAQNPPPA